MALNAASAPALQLQPLPIHEHNRPITQREDNGLAGFEQIRQQLVEAGRLVGAGTAQPAGAPPIEPTVGGRPTPLAGEGNARRTVPALPGAAPVAGVREIPAFGTAPLPGVGGATVPAATPERPAGAATAPAVATRERPTVVPERTPATGVTPPTTPQITLEHVRELLTQAAGRTNLAATGATRQPAGLQPVPEVPARPTPLAAPRPGAEAPEGPAPRPAPPSLAQLGPEIAQATAVARLQAAVQNVAARNEGAPGVAPRPRILIDQVL